MVLQWLALLPQSKKVPGLNLPADWGLSAWSLHACLCGLLLGTLVSSHMQIRSNGYFSLAVGVNVSVTGCSSLY